MHRYCVIGAGAAGIAATRALVRAGYDVVCFEKSDLVGGHWHHDYEALHLITSRDVSGFIDDPMPREYPVFPSRDQMRDYLIDHCMRNRLREYIKFNTEVVKAVPHGLGRKGELGWDVTTSDSRTQHFDGLLVANGHLRTPHKPAIATKFSGKSVHSSEYTNAENLSGSRILVVGAGNSGCDLAVDAAQHGYKTSIAIRSGHLYQPKTLYGKPRSELGLLSRLPHRIQERILRELVRISIGDPEVHGLPAPASRSLFDNLPIVNTLLPYWIDHGRIAVVPGIQEIDGKSVSFTDNTTTEFDTILWATGFEVSLPFLREAHLKCAGAVPLRVAAGVLPLQVARLYFIGLVAPRGPQLPVYSIQSALAVQLIELQEEAPGALSDRFGGEPAARRRIDELRHVWEAEVRRTQRIIVRLRRP